MLRSLSSRTGLGVARRSVQTVACTVIASFVLLVASLSNLVPLLLRLQPAAAAVGVNDYPYANSRIDGGPDPWGYPYRECTSFAAWRITHDFHASVPPGSGNAWTWASAARRAGLAVDGNPSPGSVAVFQPGVDGAHSSGHVAVVLSSTASSVTVEDYNWRPY